VRSNVARSCRGKAARSCCVGTTSGAVGGMGGERMRLRGGILGRVGFGTRFERGGGWTSEEPTKPLSVPRSSG
jgi:hypothetical protein